MAEYAPIMLATFWSKVKVGYNFECWPWQGRSNDKGYGRFQEGMAHRFAYEHIKGDIPDGLLVRHTCDNPCCCNPSHLLVGTSQDNSNDAVDRGRTSHGQAHYKTRLTLDQVEFIRRNPDKLTGTQLAKKFGMAKSTISYIRNRPARTWKYAAA